MRLLNTETFKLHEFIGSDIPRYSILSHRWGNDEVSLHDFENGLNRGGYGWAKIVKCCEISGNLNYEWTWIDTCCIDKKSTAEVSEAINSMYRWYQRAAACLVFLPDVHTVDTTCRTVSEDEVFHMNSQCAPFYMTQFKDSVWFTRGWTLQELLAPTKILFYNASFALIGTTSAHEDVDNQKMELRALIADASSVPIVYLERTNRHMERASIAQKMSWAAKRHSTREEDTVYSLLGLFNVNMPLLYGEGGRQAFFRLQLELIKATDDESIFAWAVDGTGHDRGLFCGVLASSPQRFYRSTSIYNTAERDWLRRPYSMTNKGLEFTLWLPKVWVQHLEYSKRYEVLLPLHCERWTRRGDAQEMEWVALLVALYTPRHSGVSRPQTLRGLTSGRRNKALLYCSSKQKTLSAWETSEGKTITLGTIILEGFGFDLEPVQVYFDKNEESLGE